MKLPDFLKKHVTPAQWKRLALDDLRRDHRSDVVDLLRRCLAAAGAMEDKKEFAFLLEDVQAVCDRLRGPEKSAEGLSEVFSSFDALEKGGASDSENGSIGPVSARSWCESTGIPFPPVPKDLEGKLENRWAGCYSTRQIRMAPYNINAFIAEAVVYLGGDYALTAHDGRGINSYAFHFYLVRGPLRLFLQKAYGGVYGDAKKEAAAMRRTFKLAGRLLKAVEAAPSDAGVLEDGLLVCESDLYGSCLGSVRGASPNRLDLGSFDEDRSVMQKALEMIKLKEKS